MRNRRLMLAFVVSLALAFVVSLLSNIAATYLAPNWASRPWLVYGALLITFLVSLPLSLYLFRHTLPDTHDRATPAPFPQTDLDAQVPTWQNPTISPPPSQVPGKSYRELVGRDARIGEIIAALRDPAGKWIVALDGMGGIGKTALASEISSRALAERLFDMVVWEQAPKAPLGPGDRGKSIGALTYDTVLDSIARQLGMQDVPRLKGAEKEARVQALLQARRVLVVLDNLETARESQNEIARRFLPLLNPSKALFTSRHRFKGDLYAIHLSGLDEDGALQLVRQDAQEKGIHRVQSAEAGELKQIAQTTGGSPLAIKLVVGQLGHLPLDIVLSQLREVRLPEGDSDEDDYIRFYKGIFFPSWRLLSDEGQRLLISMAHFAPGVGGTLEAIQATSDLSGDVLTRSIDELWRLSFLDTGESPSLRKIRYYLHALTQYFVLSDIVQVLK